MADLTARRESLLDYLPGNVQQSINTNPFLNAIGKALSKPTPNFERGIEHDQYGNVADRNWLLEQARGGPPKMHPLAAEMLDKGGLLANFLAPGGVRLPTPAPKPTGIRAYHGSPHDFDKFDMSKIGTGEGAQAYGRGLYFAENEGVARSYRDALGGRGVVSPYAQSVLSVANGDYDAAIKAISARIENPGAFPLGTGELQQARKAISDLTQARDAGVRLGRMYEVNIKADPDQFLDWDKPLSQQPEAVKNWYNSRIAPGITTREIGDNPNIGKLFDVMHPEGGSIGVFPQDKLPDVTKRPADFVPTQGADLVRQHQDALRDAGIPGIKYLDQQSRHVTPPPLLDGQPIKGNPAADTAAVILRRNNGDVLRAIQELERQAGAFKNDPTMIDAANLLRSNRVTLGETAGTRNYVVFDDKLIEILRKYGLLPPVAAGTAAALNEQEPQQ